MVSVHAHANARRPRSRRGRSRGLVAGALVALLALVAGAAPALAAPPANDTVSAAVVVAPVGGSHTVDTSEATSAATDPRPSCGKGAPAQGSVWYRTTPSVRTLMRLTVTPAAREGVVALYAAIPNAGTEMLCRRVDAGSTAVAIEHVLAPRTTYLIQVGTTEQGGDQMDVTLGMYATEWAVIPPLPSRLQGVGAGSDGRQVFAFGGLLTTYANPAQPAASHNRTTWIYTPRLKRWQAGPPMRTGLSYAQPAYMGGLFFIPGGRTDQIQGTSRCTVKAHVVYNVAGRKWGFAPQYSGPALYDYATAADPGRGIYYMIGGAYDPTPCDFGSDFHDVQALTMVRAYNHRAKRWVDIPPMRDGRQGAVAVVYNGYVIVAGGMKGRNAVASTEVYDPRTRRWYVGAPMPLPTWGASAALGWTQAGRPRLVVAGGWSGSLGGVAHGVVQVYDIVANTWSYERTRMTPREASGSATLGGVLYSLGGYTGQPVRAAEVRRVDFRRR